MRASLICISKSASPTVLQSTYRGDKCWHFWSWRLAGLSWITPWTMRKARWKGRLWATWSSPRLAWPFARLARRGPKVRRLGLVFAFVLLWTRTPCTNYGVCGKSAE